MRLIFGCGFIILAASLFGCSHPDGTESFYERHPEYNQPPSYFDKSSNGDGQSLNEKYSGSKDD
jgi:hypothetical protein